MKLENYGSLKRLTDMWNILAFTLLLSFGASADVEDCDPKAPNSLDVLQDQIQSISKDIESVPQPTYKDGILFAYLEVAIGDEVYVDLPNDQRNGPYKVLGIERRFKNGKSIGYFFNILHGDGTTKWYERNSIAQLTNRASGIKLGQKGLLYDNLTGKHSPVSVYRIAKNVTPNCPTVVTCSTLKTLIQFEENGRWYRDEGWFKPSKE